MKENRKKVTLEIHAFSCCDHINYLLIKPRSEMGSRKEGFGS